MAAPAGVTDPTPGNNSATDTDARTPVADLSITKTDGQASYIPGLGLTYTIVVTNQGSTDAVIGATVDDPLAVDLSGASWTCLASPGSACGSPTLGFYSVAPCRVLDTRNPAGPLGGPALTAGATRTFEMAGSCGIPANATAVFGNVTVVAPTAEGHLRIEPSGNAAPNVSGLNYSAGQTRANNGVFALDAQGRIDIVCVQASGSAGVIVDVAGYFIE